MSNEKNDGRAHRGVPAFGRRDLMKLGAGAVVTAMNAQKLSAQGGPAVPRAPVVTRSGYRNDANRWGGNAYMDDTTRAIVRYVAGFSEANLTEPLVKALDRTLVDSMAALITGFEADSVRIAASLARKATLADSSVEKATVLGYGITTTPELASFANSCMVRHTDFNDHGPAGHASDLIPGVLAVGEALHATGAQVMMGITVGYECRVGSPAGEAGSAAMAVGKVMGLNEDRLANALTLALTPHVALNKGMGAQSMWKGCRSAEAVKCGVWAALMAREGMTGPPQPFEGVGGQWAVFGKGRDVVLPNMKDKTAVERQGFKRTPSEASSQAILELIPEIKNWTKVEEIESIYYQMPYGGWTEIADAPKFDPRNRETADHSMPYMLARALLDGFIYLDSFTPEKYRDPQALALMDRMTFSGVAGWEGNAPARITIRKKSGEIRVWDTMGGARTSTTADGRAAFNSPMTDPDVTNKFNRACEYMHIDNAQRDHARTLWGNTRNMKDIGEAMQALGKFGRPLPL